MPKQIQIDKIVIKAGKIFLDYGEATEMELGIVRGGGEFSASESVRDIDFDGAEGKTAGMQVIDDINALLKITVITASQEVIELCLPSSKLDPVTKKITSGSTGLIPLAKYRKNATLFCETADKQFKKIVIKNPLNEKGFSLAAKKKAEGEISMELQAHHDATQDHTDLYTIEDVSAIKYTVTYDGNGSTGGAAPATEAYISGATVTAAAAGTLVKTGKVFGGWNTKADGSGTAYAAAATFAITGSMTLYAVWST